MLKETNLFAAGATSQTERESWQAPKNVKGLQYLCLLELELMLKDMERGVQNNG